MRPTERNNRICGEGPPAKARAPAWVFAGLLLWLLLATLPSLASAQGGNLGLGALSGGASNAVGFGIWYSQSTLHMDAANDATSSEAAGYIAASPGRLKNRGPSLSISFPNWGLNVGFNDASAPVNGRADVNRTPGNTADDPYVNSIRRTSRTVSILYNPLRWLYVGYGKETGTVEFDQISAAGQAEKHRLGFSGGFYSFGIAVGFDPRQHKFGLILALYSKIPASYTDFSGTELGAGIGFYL